MVAGQGAGIVQPTHCRYHTGRCADTSHNRAGRSRW